MGPPARRRACLRLALLITGCSGPAEIWFDGSTSANSFAIVVGTEGSSIVFLSETLEMDAADRVELPDRVDRSFVLVVEEAQLAGLWPGFVGGRAAVKALEAVIDGDGVRRTTHTAVLVPAKLAGRLFEVDLESGSGASRSFENVPMLAALALELTVEANGCGPKSRVSLEPVLAEPFSLSESLLEAETAVPWPRGRLSFNFVFPRPEGSIIGVTSNRVFLLESGERLVPRALGEPPNGRELHTLDLGLPAGINWIVQEAVFEPQSALANRADTLFLLVGTHSSEYPDAESYVFAVEVGAAGLSPTGLIWRLTRPPEHMLRASTLFIDPRGSLFVGTRSGDLYRCEADPNLPCRLAANPNRQFWRIYEVSKMIAVPSADYPHLILTDGLYAWFGDMSLEQLPDPVYLPPIGFTANATDRQLKGAAFTAEGEIWISGERGVLAKGSLAHPFDTRTVELYIPPVLADCWTPVGSTYQVLGDMVEHEEALFIVEEECAALVRVDRKSLCVSAVPRMGDTRASDRPNEAMTKQGDEIYVGSQEGGLFRVVADPISVR